MRRFMFVLFMVAALTSCATSKSIIGKLSPATQPPARANAAPPNPLSSNPAPAEAAGNIQPPVAVPAGQGTNAGANVRPQPRSIDVPAVSVSAAVSRTEPKHGKTVVRGSHGQPYQIQVENMPIGEFINLVFGKVLDTSYSVDKSVAARKETVTLNMKGKARRADILEITQEVLKSYGLGITEKEGVFFIGPISGQPQKELVPYFVGDVPGTVNGSEQVGLFLQVYYLSWQAFAGIVTNLALSPQGKIQPVQGNSMVYIGDDADHVRAAAELIHALDRPSLSNKKMRLYYLQYLPVDTFLSYLAQALPAEGIPVAKTTAGPGLMLIPLKHIHAVLAVSPKAVWFEQVGFWQQKLDIRTISEDEPQFFVYHPRYRRASDLAKLFSSSFHKEESKKNGRASGTAHPIGPETAGLQPQRGVSEPEAEKSPQPALSFSDVSVSIDEGTNSLVITATPYEYSKIEDILEQLDRLPRQVLIEVTIGEVTLTGKYQFGIEWQIKHNGAFNGTLGTLGKLGIGTSGLVYSVIEASGDFQATLNAFAQDNVLKIISSPTLVVLDNQEANINVGTQVPILTSQSNVGIEQQGNTSLLSTIQYQQTGVILHIKPTINSQGMLTLKLKQEVSNPETNTTSSISSPLISTREIETSVALRTGTSVLLGGLISNQVTTIVNKVPGLGDIPLLSTLFKTTERDTTRDELFIVITPHILSTAQEAESATCKFKGLLDLFHQ